MQQNALELVLGLVVIVAQRNRKVVEFYAPPARLSLARHAAQLCARPARTQSGQGQHAVEILRVEPREVGLHP